MRVAANLSLLFTELPMVERIAAAATAGFAGVEVQFPYEVPAQVFKAALDRSGMPLVLINLPAGDLMDGGPGLASVPSRQGAFDAALQQALEYAAVVRPRCVNVLPGRLADGVSRDQALEALTANLHRAAEAFQALGVRVLFEAINPLDMPGFLVNTPQQLNEVLQRVAHPNCLAQLDFYHMARQGIGLGSAIRSLKECIGHVQFADCPGRGTPGTGELDIISAIQLLSELHGEMWLGAEYIPQGLTANSLEWLQDWRSRGVAC